MRPPGLLRPHENPDVIMMLCTAGHVDHGKTRLVKLLTGCNTDRLKEEQERGLTIDLGFAPCVLGGELCVGIVDVPGHEKFVKNMVAGVSGIDMTVLVIAADDGVMPQTVEHVQIMELLGVRRGIVALTKIDLVTPQRLADVQAEIAAFLEGTFLKGAVICPVSSETGEGYFEFYERLVADIRGLARRRRQGVFRMPVERTFAKHGFGMVVAGIPVAGSVRIGDIVEAVPGGDTGRVRGIQRFLRDADEGACGQCLALNIPDLTKASPVRGQVLCAPGYLRAARCFLAQVRTVSPLDTPLRHAETVKFHTGTSETTARIHLLEQTAVSAGANAWAVVLPAEPVAAAVHDRFILRRPSPALTVAGGEILGIPRDRPRKQDALVLLTSYVTHLAGAHHDTPEGQARRVEWALLHTFGLGAPVRDLAQHLVLPPDAVVAAIKALADAGRAVALTGEHFVHAERYAACLAEVEARVAAAVERDQAVSLTLGELRKGVRWPGPLWDRVQQELEARGVLAGRGTKVMLQAAVARLTPAERALMDRIARLYEETGFGAPRPDEVPDRVGAAPREVERLLAVLYDEGRLVRLSKNVVLSRETFRTGQELAVRAIQEKGVLDSADFKNLIGSTRKYALAILDVLDARHVTVRTDNLRRLAPNWERNLL